jgi:hypothetical protein
MRALLNNLVKTTQRRINVRWPTPTVDAATLAAAQRLANVAMDKVKKDHPILNRPEFSLVVTYENINELTVSMSEDLASCVKYADDVEKLLFPKGRL